MSRLEELIQELCPDGVEYKRLADIAIFIKDGTHSTYKNVDRGYPLLSAKDIYDGIVHIPENCRQISESDYNSIYKKYNLNIGDVLLTIVGTIGRTAIVTEKDLQVAFQRSVAIIRTTSEVNEVYLSHALQSSFVTTQLYKGTNKSAQGGIYLKSLGNITIPVPPLLVQEEIVRILDNFTELTAELTAELSAELTARKKQYEYYKNTLLKDSKSEMIPLSEIGSVCMCKRILKAQTTSIGDVPFYKIGTFGKEADAFISKDLFTEYKAKYSYPKKGDILISAAGTIGKTVIYDGEDAYFQDSNIVWIANDEKIVLNKYLYFCYQMQPWQASTGGTISRLYNDNIRKTKIPVPPIEEQQHIVSILDRFDTLCNDLSHGLPAEIEARQKQYEYYRDKLLSFKELEH